MEELIKISILSWFTAMAVGDIKDDSEISKTIKNLDKYLNKRKPTKIDKSQEILADKKLLKVKDVFERLIVLPEHHNELDTDKDLPTVDFCPTLLAIQALDDLLLEGNIEFRVRFGHIETGKMLIDIELWDGELSQNSFKIYNQLIKEVL